MIPITVPYTYERNDKTSLEHTTFLVTFFASKIVRQRIEKNMPKDKTTILGAKAYLRKEWSQ